jgi:hypothetical protein
MIKKYILGICKLSDTFAIVLLFAPLIFFFFFLVKPVFFVHFRKFLVTSSSAEMTKGYTDTLLSFQIHTHTRFPTLRQGESMLNFHVQTLIGRIQRGCSLRGILRMKCNGTRAETIFGLPAKRTSPFKSAGESVQSTTGSRGVRIDGQRLYYL